VNLIPHSQLDDADLIVDAVYEGGDAGNLSDDPIARLLKAGNAGHFRYCGSVENLRYLIIVCSSDTPLWPDTIDVTSGSFSCYGDNRRPGADLHDTSKNQNIIFRNIFESLHRQSQPRTDIPPVFLFSRHPTPNSPRAVMFRGVCAPGAFHLGKGEGLIAVWRSLDAHRFQNYLATFTILDIPVISRKWIQALESGESAESEAPVVWNMWLKSGLYRPLRAKPLTHIRSIEDQLPADDSKKALLFKLYRYFNAAPACFAYFAADLYRMANPRVIVERISRSAVDDGYEVIGWHQLGLDADPVCIEFILAGKCYNPGLGQRKRKSVGVKELSRLICRMKDRQIGIMLTTSIVTEQAYQETRRNQLPIIFLCGSDIVDMLYARGIRSVKMLKGWLAEAYPV